MTPVLTLELQTSSPKQTLDQNAATMANSIAPNGRFTDILAGLSVPSPSVEDVPSESKTANSEVAETDTQIEVTGSEEDDEIIIKRRNTTAIETFALPSERYEGQGEVVPISQKTTVISQAISAEPAVFEEQKPNETNRLLPGPTVSGEGHPETVRRARAQDTRSPEFQPTRFASTEAQTRPDLENDQQFPRHALQTFHEAIGGNVTRNNTQPEVPTKLQNWAFAEAKTRSGDHAKNHDESTGRIRLNETVLKQTHHAASASRSPMERVVEKAPDGIRSLDLDPQLAKSSSEFAFTAPVVAKPVSNSAPTDAQNQTTLSNHQANANLAIAQDTPIQVRSVDKIERSSENYHMPRDFRGAPANPKAAAPLRHASTQRSSALADSLETSAAEKSSVQSDTQERPLQSAVASAHPAALAPTFSGSMSQWSPVTQAHSPRIDAMTVNVVHSPDQLEVTLKPEELGRLSLKLETNQLGTQVLITAERGDTQDLARRHIEMLQAHLKDMGFENLSFAFAKEERHSPNNQSQSSEKTSIGAGMSAETTSHSQWTLNPSSGLDIKV